MDLDTLDIARWQFGITTVYHFLMVPLTIGLGLLVAFMQTMWYRTGNEQYLRMTKFWGKLFLINFVMGVATGIVAQRRRILSPHGSQSLIDASFRSVSACET